MSPRIFRHWLLLVLLPLLSGGAIYLLFRPGTLRFFVWLRETWAEEILQSCRAAVSTIHLPDFLVYNFPCGLWMFAFLNALFLLRAEKIWLMLAIAAAIFSELLQAGGGLRGTFDLIDLLTYATAAALALSLHARAEFKKLSPA